MSQFLRGIFEWVRERSWPVLMTVPWLALVAYEVVAEGPCSVDSPCRRPLGPLVWLDGLPITAMFSWILFLVAPLPALWFNGVLALLLAVTDPHPIAWVLLGTALLGLAIPSTTAHLAVQQPDQLPDPDPTTTNDTTPPKAAEALRTWAVSHGRPPLRAFAPLAALGLVALGLVASMVPALATQYRFEDGAHVVEAPVVALADLTPVVEVQGQRIQVSVAGGATGDYTVGQQVAVRVNEAVPGRAELVAEPNDPSWRTGLAGLAAGAALGWWWTRVRPQGLRHLAQAPVWRATATAGRSGIALHQGGRQVWTVHVDAHPPGMPRDPDVRILDDHDEGEWPEDPSRLSPDDLARWADESFEDEEDEEYGDWSQPDRPQPVTVDVLGMPRDAAVVALAVPGHEPVRGELKAPLRRSAPDDDVFDAAPRHAEDSDQPTQGREPAPDPNGWSVGLRWPIVLAAAVAVGLVTGWLLDGPDQTWWDWLRGLVFIGWTMPAISSLASGVVLQHPRGAIQLGSLTDQLWPAQRVSGIFPGTQAIAIRLRSPQDVLAVHPEQVGGTLEEAAATLQQWFDEADDQGGPQWRPGPLVPALLLAVATMAACRSDLVG